ncbi:hypothetical protein HOY80DRAFT_895244, partial [Tuber brumale]
RAENLWWQSRDYVDRSINTIERNMALEKSETQTSCIAACFPPETGIRDSEGLLRVSSNPYRTWSALSPIS